MKKALVGIAIVGPMGAYCTPVGLHPETKEVMQVCNAQMSISQAWDNIFKIVDREGAEWKR